MWFTNLCLIALIPAVTSSSLFTGPLYQELEPDCCGGLTRAIQEELKRLEYIKNNGRQLGYRISSLTTRIAAVLIQVNNQYDELVEVSELIGQRGERGLPGPPGSDGLKGSAGSTGANGNDGNSGDPGPEGPPGDEGPAGAIGPPGPNGSPGQNNFPPGKPGLKGQTGDQGEIGETGSEGVVGPEGPKGSIGLQGLKGPDSECPCGGNPCLLDFDIGPCDAIVPRWYYNSANGLCEPFTYGGCGGNANNFQNEDLCIDSCGSLNPCFLVDCPPGTESSVNDGQALCVPPKPRVCPGLPPGTIGVCAELCSTDANCPDTQKCCSNGCGHVCTNSVPDPCDPNPCGPCETCEPMSIVCVTTPCYQFICTGGCEECELCDVETETCISGCNSSFDPCINKECPKNDDALCRPDPCNCNEAQFFVESDGIITILSQTDCDFGENQ